MQPWKFLPSSRALSSPTRPDPVTTLPAMWSEKNTFGGGGSGDGDGHAGDDVDADVAYDNNHLALHTEPCISPVC